MLLSRRWRLRILVVLLATVVGLLLSEGVARLMAAPNEAEIAFNAPDNAPVSLYVNDHRLGFRPSAGFEGTSVSPGYKVHLRINEHSLRGPALSAPSGERWLAVGDSFTLAAQVEEEDSFVGLLSQGRQVLNGGADGYGSWQAARRYEDLSDPLALDGVLYVFFTGNDLQDNERFHMVINDASQRADGNPLVGFMGSPLLRFLGRHSYLYARYKVVQRTRELRRPDSPERNRWASEMAVFTKEGQNRLSHLWQGTEPPLRELREATRRRGDKLLVAVAPPGFAVDPARLKAAFELVGLDPASADVRAPTRKVLEGLRGMGIPSCDLHKPLKEALERGVKPYFDYDGHWTVQGHQVVAQAIEACLK